MFSSLSVLLFERLFFHPILKIWFYQTMNVLIPSELIGWGPNWQVLVHPSSSSSKFYSKAWNTGTQAWANMDNKRGELGRKNFMFHLESRNDKSLPGWQHWIVRHLNVVYKQWFKDDSSTLAEHSYKEKWWHVLSLVIKHLWCKADCSCLAASSSC